MTDHLTIDKSTLTCKTRPITWEDVKGRTFWDEDGAAYQAQQVSSASFGRPWVFVACNLKALRKGYNGQPLFPFLLPRAIKPQDPNEHPAAKEEP